MKATLILILALAVCGCAAVGLQPTKELFSDIEPDQRARDIYAIAKECWEEPAVFPKHGTVVESTVTLEGVTIQARWAAPLERSPQSPFIAIVVRPSNIGSVAEIRETQHGFIGKSGYRAAAGRWLAGDYSC